MSSETFQVNNSAVAIIGMAGRFPGARNVEQYWRNLCNGVESISLLKEEEMEVQGIDPELLNAPEYVKAAAVLDDIDLFDASFFGYSPREAEIMDPQQRFFLECAWEALENAGYDPEKQRRPVGVFAGSRTDTYLLQLASNPAVLRSSTPFDLGLGNDAGSLATRVSYKLNLKGPAYFVHTACSTSLVAVHLACQSLLLGECDVALAGGVAINVPQKTGYLYETGGLLSPDGHCRAFDARGQGTIFGSGVGIVVLKRLAEAVADGDQVRAVILGSAVNNDGSRKSSYTAPGVQGQSSVIKEALINAEVTPDSIGYIEAHGTATALGDSIEVRALSKIFSKSQAQYGSCALGSVKTNIGHLDAAAGVAGLIKAVLALENKTIPPSLHFEKPNPQIEFNNGPFFVNTEALKWQNGTYPRRAGVSSFGVGGTNAHVVLEAAPKPHQDSKSRPWQLLLFSAKTEKALVDLTHNFSQWIETHGDTTDLANVAFTLQTGRSRFSYRSMLVCSTAEEVPEQLAHATEALDGAYQPAFERPVAFLFPGGGAQYAGMGAGLYRTEPVFRDEIDKWAPIIEKRMGYDPRSYFLLNSENEEHRNKEIKHTRIALPVLFIFEYALAKLWTSWGIVPDAMLGHSLGEYVAACLARVFSPEDALALVVLRAELMETLPPGGMLSVAIPEHEATKYLLPDVSLAAVNGPQQCVVSGPVAAIQEVARKLESNSIECRHLNIDVAAHSSMVDAIAGKLESFVSGLRLHPPQLPYISNVTGRWITAQEACDPRYWARHLRETVRFGDGVEELARNSNRIFLEVGPGQVLTRLISENLQHSTVLPSQPHRYDTQPEERFLIETLGKLWVNGAEIDWSGYYADERRHRVALPSYPFERQRFWIDAGFVSNEQKSKGKNNNVAEWFYMPAWKSALPLQAAKDKKTWLLLANDAKAAEQLGACLKTLAQDVRFVLTEDAFISGMQDVRRLNAYDKEGFHNLIANLKKEGALPHHIVHLLSIKNQDYHDDWERKHEIAQAEGFYSLLWLAQALAENDIAAEIDIVTDGACSVTGTENLRPELGTIIGACKVIPQEYQQLGCRVIDCSLRQEEKLWPDLAKELTSGSNIPLIALRGRKRWVPVFEPMRLETAERQFQQNRVYLITGGMGGVGLLLAEYLGRTYQARLVLTGRSVFPQREDWDKWLQDHKEQDSVSGKIRLFKSIEAAGGMVMPLSVDVADQNEMQDAIALTLKTFGTLNGVIHAAGITHGNSVFTPLIQMGRLECEAQFRPKVKGIYVLEQVLKGIDLDFCLLISSNASVLGGLGTIAYSAANAFMDLFSIHASASRSVPWISSSWDHWPEETKQYTGLQTSLDQYTMTPRQSTEAFHCVACSAPPGHVVVATGDLASRLDLWIHNNTGNPAAEKSKTVNASHKRPRLKTIFVDPRNERENLIAEIWRRALGIEPIGVQDNFFELGGHSLLATRIVARIRDTFKVQFPLVAFFGKPTIEGMAAKIGELLEVEPQSSSDTHELDNLVTVVRGLSPEEVEREISKRINF